jgi:hypothetical protein
MTEIWQEQRSHWARYSTSQEACRLLRRSGACVSTADGPVSWRIEYRGRPDHQKRHPDFRLGEKRGSFAGCEYPSIRICYSVFVSIFGGRRTRSWWLVWWRRVSRVGPWRNGRGSEGGQRLLGSGIVRALRSFSPVSCEILNRWRVKDWNSTVWSFWSYSLRRAKFIDFGRELQVWVASRGNRGSTAIARRVSFEGLSEDHSLLFRFSIAEGP